MREPCVALLGVGCWGRNHLRVLSELGVLRSAFDADVLAAETSIPGGLRADSLEEVLADEAVKGVVVATPARTHYELARRVLESGRDVLVEKPLTLDEEEGHELVVLAAGRSKLLMVGHITLYHPAVTRLKELVSQGALGRIRYMHSNRLNLGTVREEEDILWSFAPHDVAVMLHLLDAWPRRVTALGGSYLRPPRADVTVTHLEFPEDVRAHIFVSWLHPFKEHRLVVIGDRRMAVFTDGPSGGTLTLYDHPLDDLEEGMPVARGPGTVVPFGPDEPLRLEAEHFLECMRTRAEPLSGGWHGLRVLRILEAARCSLHEGGVSMTCDPIASAGS